MRFIKNHFKYFLLSILFFNCVIVFAQKDTIYFTQQWGFTDAKHAKYYRLYAKKGNDYLVEDHYIDGALQMTGTFTSLDTPEQKYRNGYFVYYYKSGNKDNEGTCVDGKSTGEWVYYYDSKNLINRKIRFVEGASEGQAKFYDSITQKIKAVGNYRKGKKEGYWRYYQSNSKSLKCIQTFADDTLSGPVTYYDSLTQMKICEGLLKGKKFGDSWIYYFKNSRNVKNISAYAKDVSNGLQIVFDSVTQKVKEIKSYKQTIGTEGWGPYVVQDNVIVFRFVYGKYQICLDSAGQKIAEGAIVDGSLIGSWRYYYYDDGPCVSICNYVSGKLDGEFTSYDYNGILRRKDIYSGGVMLKGHCYDAEGKTAQYNKAVIWPIAAIDVRSFIIDNLHYPPKLKKEEKYGTVLVGFTIDEKGKVYNCNVISGLGRGYDEEALRVVKNMPDWIPGLREGKNCSFFMVLPVKFNPQ